MADEQEIWQSQPREMSPMTLEVIRRKAQRFERKARVNVIASIGLGVALAIGCAFVAYGIGALLPRLGWCVLGLWCAYFPWRAYRSMWPRGVEDPSTSAAVYRAELERRRDYMHNIWRRSGLYWVFLGFGLIFAGSIPTLIAEPRLIAYAGFTLGLLVFWVIAFAFQRRGTERRIREDLEELDVLEGSGPS